MSKAVSLDFDRRPSAIPYMVRGMMPVTRHADLAPQISAYWRNHRANPHELAEFNRIAGLPPGAEILPLLYPHTFGFRLAMAILTHPRFPVPIWGVLQTRNHLVQHRPIAVDEPLDFEAGVMRGRVVPKGAEFDLRTTVHVGGLLAWESMVTFFTRGRFGEPDPTSQLARAPCEVGPLAAEWTMRNADHWKFGRFTGDYNGIHLWDWYARRLGFRRALYHPPRVLGECLARLPDPAPALQQDGRLRLDAWLKGPVPHGVHVRMHAAATSHTSTFALFADDERPSIIGRLAATETPSRTENTAIVSTSTSIAPRSGKSRPDRSARSSMNILHDPANLEFTPEQMLAMGRAVVARSVAHLATVGTQPICGDVDAGELCRSLRESAPEAGSELDPLLDQLFNDLIPRSFTTPGPGYLAYIPGGGVYPAALADFIADTTNRYTGVWTAAPALVQLEANALDWLREWMGFPAGTAGLFTTGGSMAAFNAIVCARERSLGADIRSGTLYTSNQAHHCIEKAAKLAGIAADRIRMIPVDADYRMDVSALATAIAQDRALGLRPFFVNSSAGTTNTGAVDDLDAIADLTAREHMWHHVDGAYGAFFHMCPELRPLLRGLSRADSLTLDPHKGMFLPYGTGALLVRDGSALRSVHSTTAGYLPQNQDEFYDPAQYGPELSRGFPGLRVWLSVKMFGATRYRAAVAEKRSLAVWAAERVAEIPGIVMDAPPQLSLFAFHLEGPALNTQAARNAATQQLVQRVTARGKIMLTGCTLDGRYLARVCVLSFRTRRAEMETCVQHLAEEAAAVLASAV